MSKLQRVQAKVSKLGGAYDRVFASPDGQAVLQDLEFHFNGTTLRKVNGKIDPHASIAAGGCREVLLHIENMRKRYAMD